MMNEQLTAEDFKVLEWLDANSISISSSEITTTDKIVIRQLSHSDYIISSASGVAFVWQLLGKGRKALATYKAQRDMVLFIAEFEERLEAEADKVAREYNDYADEWNCGEQSAMTSVLRIYRECKQRIEQPCDE